MDRGTIIGLVAALVAIFGAAVVESGSISILLALLNAPSAMIVFGGTLGAVIVSFPLSRVLQLTKVLGVAFRDVPSSERDLVEMFVRLAERARREGLLALEGEASEIADHHLKKGLLLVVDGTDPELVREIMESDVTAMADRHEGRYAMFEAAGGFAPTMGIIGTVMGLVNVLSHLDKPDELGKSIATAFIATLYGVLSANVFWLPVAQRLKQRNREEVAQRQLAVEGVLSVQAGDNPRVVREKLESFLPRAAPAEPSAESDTAAAGGDTPAAQAA
ncbi:MAG TPA: flagellar motor protein [Chloroflexota bacterium]|nr:flagellar motor protein [Chloroflexota bacterium]